MGIAQTFTCDRCGATSATGAGWRVILGHEITDGLVSADPVEQIVICLGCTGIVTLALVPDPLAGIPTIGE